MRRSQVQGLGLDTSYVKRTRCKYCADAYSTTRICKSDLMLLHTSNPYNEDSIAII